ncbi:alpha/beta hydrolase [Roseobacter sp. EG26]|uniref:alpha/beta hydrolase n=1 Tax=Roseobacter sp. EG26 TaxID=3412477 RepID=UPI003CE5C70A
MSLVRTGINPLKEAQGLVAVAIIVVASLLLVGCQQVAVLTMNQMVTTEFQVMGTKLLMRGEINSRSLGQFEEVYAENPDIDTLVQLDVPGSIDDDVMVAFGYRLRELGLNTHLTARSEVYSGGVDLFLAGVERTMEPGATLGVHSWSDGIKDAQDYPKSAPAHQQNRLYIERMLGNDTFYWFTIYAASAENIHIMTEAEIRRYGLLTN